MAKYLTLTLLGMWLVFTFTAGSAALTGLSFVKIRAAVHRDVLVKAPTFDLLPR
jgi:hypothetical protein